MCFSSIHTKPWNLNKSKTLFHTSSFVWPVDLTQKGNLILNPSQSQMNLKTDQQISPSA